MMLSATIITRFLAAVVMTWGGAEIHKAASSQEHENKGHREQNQTHISYSKYDKAPIFSSRASTAPGPPGICSASPPSDKQSPSLP
jgi:hypothetical protein